MKSVVFALGCCLLVTGCSSAAYSPPVPPSETAARQYLDQIVQRVEAKDFAGLCKLGTSECQFVLNNTGSDAAPTSPPTVVSVVVVPTQEVASGTWHPGGILFKLCGLDGLGMPYGSEMLVSTAPTGSGLIAQEPVYWSGMTVDSSVAEPTAIAASADWAGCP
jgi:hypothetical protein